MGLTETEIWNSQFVQDLNKSEMEKFKRLH
jgi:hypothetical protein